VSAQKDAGFRAETGKPGGHVDSVPPNIEAKLLSSDDSRDHWADMNADPNGPRDWQLFRRVDRGTGTPYGRHHRIEVKLEKTRRREQPVTDGFDLLKTVMGSDIFER
jgi:hypothetical protein